MLGIKKLKTVLLGSIGILLIASCDLYAKETTLLLQNQQANPFKSNLIQLKNGHMTHENIFKHLKECMLDSKEENLDIRESPDGSYLCGIDSTRNHLVVLNNQNEVVINEILLSPVEQDLTLSFCVWGNQKNWLWLTHNSTNQVKDFIRIDLNTGASDYYQQTYGFEQDFALEPDTGYLCFSDFPTLSDFHEEKSFLAKDHQITLRLVHLLEKGTPQVIETATNKAFEPRWAYNYSFTYNNPYFGDTELEKVTYAFNQSFELRDDIDLPIVYETQEAFSEKYDYVLKVLKNLGHQTDEVIDLYGYSVPIKDILIHNESSEIINLNGFINWFNDTDYLLLSIDHWNTKDINRLAHFLGTKYNEHTVRWLMEKFIHENNSYTLFKDGSYIRISLTTAGFKFVQIGYIKDINFK